MTMSFTLKLRRQNLSIDEQLSRFEWENIHSNSTSSPFPSISNLASCYILRIEFGLGNVMKSIYVCINRIHILGKNIRNLLKRINDREPTIKKESVFVDNKKIPLAFLHSYVRVAEYNPISCANYSCAFCNSLRFIFHALPLLQSMSYVDFNWTNAIRCQIQRSAHTTFQRTSFSFSISFGFFIVSKYIWRRRRPTHTTFQCGLRLIVVEW